MSEIGINNYDLNDIYNIKNPLDDDEIIEEIIKMKGKDGRLHYDDIQAVNSQGNPKDGIYGVYSFYAFMFNIWKDNFLKFDPKKLGPKSLKLYKTLEKFKDIKNAEEIDDKIAEAFYYNDEEMIVKAINGGEADKDLEEAVELYRWNNRNTQTDGFLERWQFVASNMVTLGNREKVGETKHRLYLNPKPDEIYIDICNFVKFCEVYNMPYYFKFNDSSGYRSDGIVIYSDSKNLENYLKILTAMKERKIFRGNASFEKPPMLTGVIDDWIGYGQEPKEHDHSYTSIRKELLDDATNRVAIKYAKEHIDDVIEYEGKKGTLKEFLLEVASERFKPKDEISNHLDRILQECLSKKPADEYQNVSKVIKEKINQMIPQIAVINSNYINEVRKQIKIISKEYDVDENNMCFNEGEREKIKPKQYGEDTENNIQILLDSLVPAIRNGKMNLPNGKQISTEEYIRTIYAPYIPKSGLVTLKDGRKISVTQFFEDGIYWEGHHDYNRRYRKIFRRCNY